MKVLVLGASGMLGHTVANYFLERGHEVTTYSRKPVPFGRNITGDITDPFFLTSLLQGDNYDAVINCIALFQGADDKSADAIYLNSYLPHQISSMLRGTGTRLIHISSDGIFSGLTGPYSESSLPDGTGYYSRSKALGEVSDTDNLTFRTSIIGPDINPAGVGLLNWFMQQPEDAQLKGFSRVIWTGVSSLTLAQAAEQALLQNLTGIYHLVNGHSISKYELVKLFKDTFRPNSPLIIEPSDTIRSDRTLVDNRKDFDFDIPSYQQMLADLKIWVTSHPDLYPHYLPLT